MSRFMPLKANASRPTNPFIFDNQGNRNMPAFSWQILHNKTLRTSGRGGKGHFVSGARSHWNRKGRWNRPETKKPS